MLAGCGGQGAPGRQALQQEAAGLQSVAAEGGILAADAAGGRSTSTFVGVHAAELHKAARTSARAFANGRTPTSRALATLAVRVGAELERLRSSSSDPLEQRRLATALEREAAQAEQLGKRL